MGRDITGLRIDKIPNNVPKSNGINHVTVHVTPRIAAEKVEETDSNADDENGLGKQDVLGALLSSSAAPVPFAMEKEHSGATINGAVKISDTDLPMTANLSQLASRKPVRPDGNRYHDDEDNISLASSVATSVRSTMSRVTVPVAPKFVCNDRLSRRKEFYTKLEEKHRALEAEKIEVAARTKEEEEAAIKQLRKTTAYKANPVPSFYREGPPPKVELKKLPVTRAKSPNLSRRKSCSDAMKPSPSPDEKCNNNCARIKRHSIGPLKPFTTTTPPPPTTTYRNKNPTCSRNPNSTTPKTKDAATTGSRNSSSRSSKEGIFTPPTMKSKSFPGKTNTAAANKSKNHAKEVKETSSKVAEMSMADSVAEVTETMASPTAMKDKIGTNTDTENKDCTEEVNETSLEVADMSMADCVADTSPTALKEKIRTDADMDIPIVEEDDEAVEPKAVEPKTADIAVET